MLIVTRVFWFLESAVTAALVGLIVLMILRLIVDAADLNPFGWAHRTTRRLSDHFVFPVRGALREFGANPKFAPLVVILVVVLMGFLVLNLLQTLSVMVQGVVLSLRSGAVASVVGYILHGLISIYILMIFLRIIFSMARVSYMNRFMRFLVNTTEPLLAPLRRLIPPVGRWDISPIVAFIILWLLQQAIAGSLMRGTRFGSF